MMTKQSFLFLNFFVTIVWITWKTKIEKKILGNFIFRCRGCRKDNILLLFYTYSCCCTSSNVTMIFSEKSDAFWLVLLPSPDNLSSRLSPSWVKVSKLRSGHTEIMFLTGGISQCQLSCRHSVLSSNNYQEAHLTQSTSSRLKILWGMKN